MGMKVLQHGWMMWVGMKAPMMVDTGLGISLDEPNVETTSTRAAVY